MLKTDGVLMIEAAGLSKFYGAFAAIRDVSFSVRQGQVTAFLGPNGAGKSTTLKILTGYLSPSAGTARIAGLDVASDRIEAVARVGYLPENGPRGLTDGRLADRMEAVIAQCNLQSVAEKSIYTLSKGYRQRVGMAQVLLHEPDILIMDEPTSGLDPNQIRDVRELVRELGETKTILISTHILQEVKAVADQVILIHEGRIVFDGTPDEMADGETLEDAFYRLTAHGPDQQSGADSEAKDEEEEQAAPTPAAESPTENAASSVEGGTAVPAQDAPSASAEQGPDTDPAAEESKQ